MSGDVDASETAVEKFGLESVRAMGMAEKNSEPGDSRHGVSTRVLWLHMTSRPAALLNLIESVGCVALLRAYVGILWRKHTYIPRYIYTNTPSWPSIPPYTARLQAAGEILQR